MTRPNQIHTAPPAVALISLGCAKNTVDSECILGNLISAGLLVAEDPADADICLVNTCGFIDDARAEAAGVLNELAELKKSGRPRVVVALGCLVERTADCPELDSFLKDADARIGFLDYNRLPEICLDLLKPQTAARAPHRRSAQQSLPKSFMNFLKSPRARIGSVHSAYLKVAEGCSNVCRFCSIPRIRGLQVSRPMEDILFEAGQLVRSGAREINLIAQDTSNYGQDLYGSSRLPELLRKLKDVDPTAWYRILYCHPRHLSEELLDMLAVEPHLCQYIDLPLQHISDPILEAMGRGMGKSATLSLLDLIARKLPEGALRTTFIVGYPGETEEQFNELMELVRERPFMHLGVFVYSREPMTPAAKLDDNVPPDEKARRRDALMLAQLEVSRKRMSDQVGKQVEIMLDGLTSPDEGAPDGVYAIGRTRLQAPDVDGVVYLRGKPDDGLNLGDRLRVRVVKALDYDLVAETLS
jgi:ribosomal protein S12 methylthiotransferase